MKLQSFYSDENEFEESIHFKLKLFFCPKCNRAGFLILHGYLESSRSGRSRGHRIFCSNRGRKKGCGKTITIYLSDYLPGYSLSAQQLWLFLLRVQTGMEKFASYKSSGARGSPSTAYRIFRVFIHNQTHIRTHLHRILKPPDTAFTKPFQLTISHMENLSPEYCPVKTFQTLFQTQFLLKKVLPKAL